MAAICAYLKLFYKTLDFTFFIIIGIVFSILEFILRIPTKYIGIDVLDISIISMQIVWVGMNLLVSSVLSIYLYSETITISKIIAMFMILSGVYIGV